MAPPEIPNNPPSDMDPAEAIRKGIIHTHVSPWTARAMVWGFLAIVFGIPFTQTGIELARGERPRVLNLVTLLTHPHPRVPTQHELRAFEEGDLADASVMKHAVQPALQEALTVTGGFGNTKGVLGRDGWLFYQPGIDYVAGHGILDAGRIRAKAKKMIDGGEREWHADPRPAILQFHRDCEAAGVRLILVPVPDKAGCQPGQLTARLADYSGPPLVNRDHDRLLAELTGAGVEVYDPRPAQVRPGEARYLKQDTHWTPGYMENVAEALAMRIGSPGNRAMRVREMQVSRIGDIVDMLKLPANQAAYTPQTVTIHQVVDAQTSEPWQPRDDADVLLLGDSFTNIYTAAPMGWGESAGLGPQLARFLARGVDVIARNGSGASLTRSELARRADPLGGKKVVVWQFAARDLYGESWLPIPMVARKSPATAASDAGEVVVTARLLAPPPRVTTTEVYADALIVLQFKVEAVISGKCQDAEVLAAMVAMRNRAVLPTASFKVGSLYRLTLLPNPPREVREWKKLDNTDALGIRERWASDARPE